MHLRTSRNGFPGPVSNFQGPDLALVNAAWAMSRFVPTRAHSRSAAMLVCHLRKEAIVHIYSICALHEESTKITSLPITGTPDR